MSLNYKSLLIALAAFLWATDSLLRLPLTRELSAATIVMLEHLLAMVIVVPWLFKFWPNIKKLTARQWWGIGFVAVLASALATMAFTASFKYVSPSVSILLQKMQPLVTFAVASLWLRESWPRHFWRYAAIALAGGYLISFPALIPDLRLYSNGAMGVGLALLAAALWGSATVVGRSLLRDLPPNFLTTMRFAVALPFLVGWWFVGGGAAADLANLNWRDIFYVTIIMIGPGFGAMWIYYKGLSVTRASVSAILELAWPLAAVVLNWVFLQQTLNYVQLLGGVILIFATTKLSLWSQQS